MSLAATWIQNVRIANPDFDKNEHRLSEYGALDFFYQQSQSSPLLTDEMRQKAIESAGQTLQIPVLKYDGTIAVSNSRSCTIADAENESALVSATFVTYFVGFTMVPSMYSNNDIGYEKDLTAKLKKCARVLGAALDSAAISALESNKSQKYADSLLYDTTGNVLGVDWESREDILGDIEPIMAANDFYGSVHIIGNAGVQALLRKLAEHSTYNEYDNTLEWSGKYFHFTNRLANASGKYATFYAVEDGNVDMLFRYDREAVLGANAVGHEWDIVTMPYLNIPVGLHYYVSVGDQSGIAGDATADLTCARKEYYGFSVDVAFVVAYNSALASRANPIAKAAITKGDNYARPVKVVSSDSDPVITKTAA